MKRICSLAFGLLVAAGIWAQGFSVSDTAQVVFAPGNLQYLATQNTFRFAPEQFTVVGYQNDSIGEHNCHWQDLFGWATSGYDNTTNDRLAIHFQPWAWICELGAELDYELNQFGYGPSENMPDRSLVGTAACYDWGQYCRIGNDEPGTWRSLSREEWRYLLFLRNAADEKKQMVSIKGVKGLLLWPDNVAHEKVSDNLPVAVWKSLESKGCVFLPMAGARYHFRTADVNRMGGYWTSTGHDQASAYFVGVYAGYTALSSELYGRHTGRSVRLARNISGSSQMSSLRYEDASRFRIINQAYGSLTGNPFTRMDTTFRPTLDPAFWRLQQNSAGIGIRFRSNSTTIAVRYCLMSGFRMSHMAETGIKGTDLYILGEDNRWHYINTSKPTSEPVQNKTYVSHLDGNMHEYLIYLPLYDGIDWMQIGVDQSSVLEYPSVNNPQKEHRIVCFGTSVMQGGCASRPGMVATSMVQRDMNMECINLATSGVGRILLANARAVAAVPGKVDAFVLDPVPNSTQGLCDTVSYDFVRIIRQAHPESAIIMVESAEAVYTHYDTTATNSTPNQNRAWRNAFERLKAENPNRIYLMTHDGQLGPDEEGTVDGIHLTDYGFRAYADILESILFQVFHNY